MIDRVYPHVGGSAEPAEFVGRGTQPLFPAGSAEHPVSHGTTGTTGSGAFGFGSADVTLGVGLCVGLRLALDESLLGVALMG